MSAFNCNSSGCGLHITHPPQGRQLECLKLIRGRTHAGQSLCISVDNHPPLHTVADSSGAFCAANPYPLASGAHKICVLSCPSGCCVCHGFTIRACPPVPPPTIDSPAQGAVLEGPSAQITGRGIPGFRVQVCLPGHGCRTALVGPDGQYTADFGPLADGEYTVTAVQVNPDGCPSPRASSSFAVGRFMVQAIDARMGRYFRTVDADVLISGAAGPATVYYLLLPPGSAAPTAAEIMDYQNTPALLNGTAATGQLDVTIAPGQSLYTWALTGLDKPGAPAGVTGVIDGYRYDVYMYIVFANRDSGVLSFGRAARGMPFATGLGTADSPFTIRQLTADELALYPDLVAGNPLNVPGVDETARMLENIERLITLYEATDGYYGLEESMALDYLMTSDINLAGYAAAYGGEGWQAIGDIDGWINDRKLTEHLFSGVFDGGSHTISNLSITPAASADNFVGYRGLFGGVDGGTLRRLALSGVVINAFASAPGQAQLGSFISIARSPVLDDLSLVSAGIVADIEEIFIGDTHAVNAGGFVGEIFDGGLVSNITGSGITITVPTEAALALGGFVGFTDKLDAYESYQNIALSGVTISGFATIGGLAGRMVYGVNHIDNARIEHITITAPGGQAGGLIGQLYIYSGGGDCLVENSGTRGVSVFLGGQANPGGEIGGLIGTIRNNPFADVDSSATRIFGVSSVPADMAAAPWPAVAISRCGVKGGQINCGYDGGGLIGHVSVLDGAAPRTTVSLCRAVIPVSAASSNAGGLVGNNMSCDISQCFASGRIQASGSPSGGPAGGLVGSVEDSAITDCYALGSSSASPQAGGVAGAMISSEIRRCYSAQSVNAYYSAGGIAGEASLSTLQGSLVLGGQISASSAHRVLGQNATSTLQSNYALDTVVPVPALADPNGPDGGTITSGQIVPTMLSLGWDTAAVWDASSVAALGRPTLVQNPE